MKYIKKYVKILYILILVCYKRDYTLPGSMETVGYPFKITRNISN